MQCHSLCLLLDAAAGSACFTAGLTVSADGNERHFATFDPARGGRGGGGGKKFPPRLVAVMSGRK